MTAGGGNGEEGRDEYAFMDSPADTAAIGGVWGEMVQCYIDGGVRYAYGLRRLLCSGMPMAADVEHTYISGTRRKAWLGVDQSSKKVGAGSTHDGCGWVAFRGPDGHLQGSSWSCRSWPLAGAAPNDRRPPAAHSTIATSCFGRILGRTLDAVVN